ncbi:radical SAM/SPASM domain-containing protein [Dyadobacter sp. LHD-138]|uniref:radical SAM/SPASM domain-containing protein n=1 Tax=Dyadobacter sp. LHD-138 TaxID=3071413 RepID=UPI0027DFDA0C|nr:radical SAM protein [Dyadobacter sp. LHD-138]MDQ6477182.1 radical SAM protein [Dyadobacter sp. LHD-138]
MIGTAGSLVEKIQNVPIAIRLAQMIVPQSKPRSAHVHLIKGGPSTQIFIPNGSRLYTVSQDVEQRITSLMNKKDEKGLQDELIILGLDAPEYITNEPLQSPPLHALSLAIAQKCNMGCTYCYADQGDFGGPTKNMSLETAFKAIDLLLKDCPEGGKAQLTFLGGEPLINRQAIREAVVYAETIAKQRNIRVNYSITTNGTLVTESDAVFFEEYGFSVTISLDGIGKDHDLNRPMKGGKGSYDRIIQNIRPLLSLQKKMQVSARVTVTPENTNLPDVLDEFIHMGFHGVGFSPLLRSSNGQNEMNQEQLSVMLENMIACGLNFEKNVLAGKRYPFLNMVNALKEISKGTHRPYPCGAGAGYMGVSADEDLFACHRFVNEDVGKMGDLNKGVQPDLQNNWLASRHVNTQEPCSQCWARYLCGGGCHHEVIEKGRPACNYIRSWLFYTIQANERLSRLKPNWNN